MSDGKQLALDTDWTTALVACITLVILALIAGVAAWHVIAGEPSVTHVPRMSAMNVLALIFGLWLGLGPGSSRLPRVVRIFILIWAAEFIGHGLMIVMHVTTQTWTLVSPLESWFHVIVAGVAFVYLAAWLKGTIRRTGITA